jgi:hypothetical protein
MKIECKDCERDEMCMDCALDSNEYWEGQSRLAEMERQAVLDFDSSDEEN